MPGQQRWANLNYRSGPFHIIEINLKVLPAMRFDTAYRERRVGGRGDGYVEVRGNRYSVPGELCGALEQAMPVERRELAVYEEVAQWS
jgi:hypothetical protein